MTKKACSKGSSMAAAVANIWFEAFLDDLRNFERMKCGFFNAHSDAPQPSGRRGVRQQVVREYGVKVEDRIAIESDLVRRADEECDGVLVVENHLSFKLFAAFGLFAELDQAPRIEQRVGVAFEAT